MDASQERRLVLYGGRGTPLVERARVILNFSERDLAVFRSEVLSGRSVPMSVSTLRIHLAIARFMCDNEP
jgi:hypothetical protein